MGKVLAIGLVTVGVVGTATLAPRLSGIWERMVSWGYRFRPECQCATR